MFRLYFSLGTPVLYLVSPHPRRDRPAAGSIDSTIMPLRTVDDVGKDEFSEYFVVLLNTLGDIMYAFLFQI